MQVRNNRRKRKRTPTLTPRFGAGSVALEIALIRQALDAQRNTDRNPLNEHYDSKGAIFPR